MAIRGCFWPNCVIHKRLRLTQSCVTTSKDELFGCNCDYIYDFHPSIKTQIEWVACNEIAVSRQLNRRVGIILFGNNGNIAPRCFVANINKVRNRTYRSRTILTTTRCSRRSSNRGMMPSCCSMLSKVTIVPLLSSVVCEIMMW